MDITKKWIEDINKRWFKNHTTEIEKINDRLTIIYFRNPKDFAYYMKIVLSDNMIFISGDVGEAVFCLTEDAQIEKIAKYDMYYFKQKLKCASCGKTDYDHDIALQDLRQWLRDMFEYHEEKKERQEIKELYNDLKYLANDVNSCDEWVTKIYGDYEERLSEFDELFESSIWDVGKVTPIEIFAYLEAFKIINKQLSKENKISA